MESVAATNKEAADAWSGPLFDRFVKYRDLVTGGLGAHGEEALAAHPPRPGDRVLDLGCGFGDTTQRLAELVGTDGEAVGIDVSEPFIAAAREEAEAAGVERVSFAVADVQVGDLGGGFDYAFSRMGMMFFANPVQALRNVREALVPGGRLCAVVWRRKEDNEWVRRAELVVDEYLEHPEETEEPTCGPGPFSMANADTVSEQLKIAGFESISLRRCDLPLKIGNDLDHAVEFNMALGPAGEVLRLWEDRIDEIRPKIAHDLREALNEFDTADGVFAPASTWIIGATAP
jgi:ubiquinone/menaquinone biosynthesis C-methylase UbiE